MLPLEETQIIDLPDAPATHRLGEQLGRSLAAGTILLLEGDLGTGKTTLVQGIGQGLGIVAPIVSPTFTLVNEYLDGRIPLYHMDLYRLEPDEVQTLYLEQYWNGQDQPLGIVAIEWPERLISTPRPHILLTLRPLMPTGRQAHLTPVGKPDPEVWTL
ncbi:MAG: tRNA (adenosine(37)-N6)-threonylcarbamoyltransferase complex ATPase subunit type 1 TsaE [Cyanobacteria bacterium J069]|nr:MAG: tRNA (adenosine(37)-N6)-threonylcarbamoyltransferase complex ATPase subunit type 1 TsaE [Cyanobacteria bacterium J069]